MRNNDLDFTLGDTIRADLRFVPERSDVWTLERDGRQAWDDELTAFADGPVYEPNPDGDPFVTARNIAAYHRQAR